MDILNKDLIIRMKIYSLFVFCILVCSNCTNTGKGDKSKYFSNPILEQGADPYVYHHSDGLYYCMVTRGNRLTLWKAKTFTDLSSAETKDVWFPPETGPNSSNIWAPEIQFIKGAWYIYYTACDKKNQGDQTRYVFVLRNNSENPLVGNWDDLGKIDTEYPGIDGEVFEYKGEYYFLYSPYVKNQSGLIIAKMNSPWEIEKPSTLLALPKYDWEKTGIREIMEGPQFLVGPGDEVFIVYSAAACWDDNYGLGMLTAKKDANLLDSLSWSRSDIQVFKQCPENSVYGPGHNCFTKSPDGKEDWIVYHGKKASSNECSGRSMRAQPFIWDKNGRPLFGKPLSLATKIKVPSGL
jgi:GH43 family beta-xylosidase